MSYQRLKEAEAALMEEIDALIQQANQCDEEEDRRYQDRTGFEIPDDLKFKETRLEKIKAARQAIEDHPKTPKPQNPKTPFYIQVLIRNS